jgi:hypothetical protein
MGRPQATQGLLGNAALLPRKPALRSVIALPACIHLLAAQAIDSAGNAHGGASRTPWQCQQEGIQRHDGTWSSCRAVYDIHDS